MVNSRGVGTRGACGLPTGCEGLVVVVGPEGVTVDAGCPGVSRYGPSVAFDFFLCYAGPAADECVCVEVTIEVSDFVLETTREESVAFDAHWFTMFVGSCDACPVGAAGGEVEAGDREAPFCIGAVGGGHCFGDVRGFQDGVNDASFAAWPSLGFEFVFCFCAAVGAFDVGAVIDEESLGDSNLVGGEANAAGEFECFVHIGDELGDVFGRLGDWLGRVVEDGVTGDNNWAHSHEV